MSSRPQPPAYVIAILFGSEADQVLRRMVIIEVVRCTLGGFDGAVIVRATLTERILNCPPPALALKFVENFTLVGGQLHETLNQQVTEPEFTSLSIPEGLGMATRASSG